MRQDDFEEFRKLVVMHYELYPSATLTEATISAWWAELEPLPLDVLPEAFRRARRGAVQFAPSAEAVREVAQAELRRRVVQPQARAPLPLPGQDPHPLAKQWAEESRRAGVQPDEVTPHSLAERRLAQIKALLDGFGDA